MIAFLSLTCLSNNTNATVLLDTKRFNRSSRCTAIGLRRPPSVLSGRLSPTLYWTTSADDQKHIMIK